MDIPGISSSDPFSAAQTGGTQQLDRGAFMELLVTQLENQDPLDPVANEQFVAQLAQFSSLEQLEGLNQNIVAMIALNQSNALLSQLTQSSALIGKEVSWEDPTTGVVQSGEVESVKIVDGLAVLRIGEQDVPLALVTQIEDPTGSDAA
jgi:flagellar basal-body rod modification protein FlgD